MREACLGLRQENEHLRKMLGLPAASDETNLAPPPEPELFPTTESLPALNASAPTAEKGGFGNLIALPLQKACRALGNTE